MLMPLVALAGLTRAAAEAPWMRPTALLRPCTVVVAGANGRVGSMVCRQLLRTQPQVTVRALVRSADRVEDYARLSYEVGAEDASYALRPAWSLAPEEDGGGLAWATQSQFDESVQGDYGLDRLELFPCELRHEADLKAALSGTDALIYCASDFSSARRRLPQQVDNALAGIAKIGADLLELRLPGFGRGVPGQGEGGRDEQEEARLARLESIRAFEREAVDDGGVGMAAALVANEIGRKTRLTALTSGVAGGAPPGGAGSPTPFVLASASAALGYEDAAAAVPLLENEFGIRKRTGEAAMRKALRTQGVMSAVVRLAEIDSAAPEGRPLCWAAGLIVDEMAGEEAGKWGDELRTALISPRDAAAALVEALAGEGRPPSGDWTRDVWTQTKAQRAEPPLS